MKYQDMKVLVDIYDNNDHSVTLVNFKGNTNIVVKYNGLRLDEAIPEALNLYKEYLPAGGIEFWDMEVNETLNGTWTPDFIEEMFKNFERTEA